MTQEQLAMLLGVSRQAVTKWEAEKSYPEMDKLLKMCSLFDCTIDELVQGDLTERPLSAPAGASAAIAQDVCGYDEHMRRFSLLIAASVALLGVGLAASVLLEGANANAGDPDLFSGVALFILLAAAASCAVPAGMGHAAFIKAHPFVEDFYTLAQKDRARRNLTIAIVAGIVLFAFGMIVPLLAEGLAIDERVGTAAFLLMLGAAGAIVSLFAIRFTFCDIEAYNQARDEGSEERKREKRLDPVYGIIMIVSTAVGLGWLFGSIALAPGGAGAIDWGHGYESFFWTAWVVGGLACGIVSLVDKARRG